MPSAIQPATAAASSKPPSRRRRRRHQAAAARTIRTLGGSAGFAGAWGGAGGGSEAPSLAIEDSQQLGIGLQEDGRLVVDHRLVALQGAQEAIELGVLGVGRREDVQRLGLAAAADRFGLRLGRGEDRLALGRRLRLDLERLLVPLAAIA